LYIIFTDLEIQMAQAIVRKGIDATKGHSGFPPTTAVEASTDVFINKVGAVRMGDSYAPHCNSGCHVGKAMSTSTVFINNKPVHRMGDDLSCGDKAVVGSPNVFAG
jgi:uncharacterized Zn-binding protein involved in type VI secretion